MCNLDFCFRFTIFFLLISESVGTSPPSVQTELVLLALPAIAGQAIEPLAQLMETAYIGRLGNFLFFLLHNY